MIDAERLVVWVLVSAALEALQSLDGLGLDARAAELVRFLEAMAAWLRGYRP